MSMFSHSEELLVLATRVTNETGGNTFHVDESR